MRNLRWRKAPADPEHDVGGIVAALAPPPFFELLGEVGGGLAGERRIGGADAFAPEAVAGRAGGETPLGIVGDV